MLLDLIDPEFIELVCHACSGNSPDMAGTGAGAAGQGAGSQGPSSGAPGVNPCGGGTGSDPSGIDIATDVATSLAAEAAIEAAAQRAGATGAAGATLGVFGTVTSGSQSLAEAITTVHRNGGRGFGGSRGGGKSSMDAAMAEIRGEGSAVQPRSN